jgi:hypothetical protein
MIAFKLLRKTIVPLGQKQTSRDAHVRFIPTSGHGGRYRLVGVDRPVCSSIALPALLHIVPLGGLGSKLDAVYGFHTQYGIKPQRGHGRHDAKGSIIRWCFADLLSAEDFARQFKT